jgi:hypothetical protein
MPIQVSNSKDFYLKKILKNNINNILEPISCQTYYFLGEW